MLIAREIHKTYGLHTVLNDVTLILNDEERIGLVGANGAGKSTLLKIITGQVEADGGSVQVQTGARVGYLAQTLDDVNNQTVNGLINRSVQHIRDLEDRMRHLENRMTAEDDDLDAVMAEYGEALERFERWGGYALDSRVEIVLEGLRIAHIARDRPARGLSGGEQARFSLAALLLSAPDVLLLDEPTNHLDFATLDWLESYIRQYRGAVLIVSHDRQFLNRTVSAIVEIDEHSHQARRYSGDYDAYYHAKQQERRKWEEDYAKQQDEIKDLRLQIKETARRNDNYRAPTDGDKFIYVTKKAKHERTVAKRVRSAEERLKRIEADPIPEPPQGLRFDPDFDPQMLNGRVALRASGLCKRYGARQVLDDLTFVVGATSRIVLMGPNGAGKSTLLRLLVGEERPDSGGVTHHPALNIGYLDQHGALLDPEMTVFEAYRHELPETDQQLKATLLTAGLFRYDDLNLRVGQISSGQIRKLQIGRVIASRANLLVLDEPTNHVSFDVLEGLEEALRQFPGPIIAASHDRRFMQGFGGQIWELRDGCIATDVVG